MGILGIGNGARGCGKKKGGYYLSSTMGPGGMLLPLVWCNGSMVLDNQDKNLNFAIPPLKHYAFDPEQTLDGGAYIDADVGAVMRSTGAYTGSGRVQLTRLVHAGGQYYGLAHHVGTEHYTAASKAVELACMGPSERVSPVTALMIAPLLKQAPIRLYYTHAKVPHFVDGRSRDQLMEYVHAERQDDAATRYVINWQLDDAEFGLTSPADRSRAYEHENWRWTMIRSIDGSLAMPNNGRNHWFARALSYLERHPEAAGDGVKYMEAMYCGTWITDALKVVENEDLQGAKLSELRDEDFLKEQELKAGIKVAALPPKGQDEWEF